MNSRASRLPALALAVSAFAFGAAADARAQAAEKLTIVIFSPPSLGALLPPVIKAQKFDIANGTKRGSAFAAASSPSFISLHQVSPWSGGSSLPNQSGQPPLTCLSMPCLSIQASRPETSLKPFMIGRLGLPPPKASDKPAGSSTIRSAGKRGPSLRMVARRSGGIMWPCVSMITGQAPFVFSRAAAIISPSCATLIGSELTTMPSGRTASFTALAPAAEITALARALLAEHSERRRCLMMDDFDWRYLVRRRQEVVH